MTPEEIAEHIRQAIIAERERCADIVRSAVKRWPDNPLVASVIQSLFYEIQGIE